LLHVSAPAAVVPKISSTIFLVISLTKKPTNRGRDYNVHGADYNKK